MRLMRVLALGLLGQACLRLKGFLAIGVKTGLSSLGSGPEHLICVVGLGPMVVWVG